MKKNVMLGLVVASMLAITGCASTNMEKRAEEESKVMNIRADAAKEQREKEQARMEGMIKQVPAWALETPRPDGTGIYSVGMSENNVLRVALRQATLEAEYGLAKTYNQELSGSERSYTQSNGSQTSTEQYTALIDKLVSQVPVAGFEVVRQEIKPIDGKYHAFVMLKLPYEQFNRILQDQRAKQTTQDKTVAAAFDDLSVRLEKRRQQRIEEQQLSSVQPIKTVSAKSVDVTAKSNKPAEKSADQADTE